MSLAKAKFTSANVEELKQLKDFAGDESFNLSVEEISKIRTSAASGQTLAKAVSKIYRNILAGRMKAYHKSCILGVAPYDRGKAIQTSAASDLKTMTKASTLLAKDALGLYRTFLDYPKYQSLHIEHGFF